MKKVNVRAICEGAIMVALAAVLSYIKIPIGLLGGSINLVMIPLVVFSVRWGLGWGLGASLVFGVIKGLLSGFRSLTWASMLLDYAIAYMLVGLAGIFKGKKLGLIWGSLMGGIGRFVVHFVSGVTIYAIVGPETVRGVTTASPALYSLIYNLEYMLPSIIITTIACALLTKPLEKFMPVPSTKN